MITKIKHDIPCISLTLRITIKRSQYVQRYAIYIYIAYVYIYIYTYQAELLRIIQLPKLES